MRVGVGGATCFDLLMLRPLVGWKKGFIGEGFRKKNLKKTEKIQITERDNQRILILVIL